VRPGPNDAKGTKAPVPSAARGARVPVPGAGAGRAVSAPDGPARAAARPGADRDGSAGAAATAGCSLDAPSADDPSSAGATPAADGDPCPGVSAFRVSVGAAGSDTVATPSVTGSARAAALTSAGTRDVGNEAAFARAIGEGAAKERWENRRVSGDALAYKPRMTSFDKIVQLYRDSDPYLADTLVEMESRFNIAKALIMKLGHTDGLTDAELHKLLCEYYDRVCDAFDGEFDDEDNLTFGSEN